MKKLFFIVFLAISSVILAQKTNRNDYIFAENYFRNNEFEKALVIYKKLLDKSPYNTTYLQRLISCYQETDNFSKAENILNYKLRKNPKLSYLNVFLGHNYEKKHQLETADKFYNIALKSIDADARYATTIASFFKNYNKLNYAIKAYEKASNKQKGANYGFQIAQIYGEQGNFVQMFEQYINYLDKDRRHLNTVKHYTSKYITDDAENENNILFKKALLRRSVSNPKDVWNNLLSWLFIKQKDYNKALIQQKALYARDADNLSEIKQLGKITFESKDYEVAEQCFDFIIEKTNYPRDKFDAISKKLLIAIDTKKTNVEELFEETFTKYGVNTNTFPVQIAYAKYQTFYKNNPEKAKQVLEKALKFARSKHLKAYVKLQLGDVLVYQSKFNKALIYFSQVQTQFKNSYLAQQARFRVAKTSYLKNDFKWAKSQLKVLKGSASQLIANDAADLFLTISDNEPKDSIPTGLSKYAKADLLAFQNKNDEAIAVLDSVIVDFKGQSIEDEALFKKGKILIKQKRYNEAISNFSNIIALDKEGIYVDDVCYKMAELYNNELNNKEKAKEYYQKVIFDHPNSIYLVDARKKYRKLRGDNIN